MKSLPVVDERHRVVAVVSRRDIVRVLARADERIEYEVDDLFRDLGVDWLVDVIDGAATVTVGSDRTRAILRSPRPRRSLAWSG